MSDVDDRAGPRARWRRAFRLMRRRGRTWPIVELTLFIAALAIGVATYGILAGGEGSEPLTPALIALLLVANLVPAIILLMLLGRRFARARANRSALGGGGRLHVRLVAIFSLLASVPMLLVVVVASFLFQYGIDFWSSDRARGMLENASEVAQAYYDRERGDIANETITMSVDLYDQGLQYYAIDASEFQDWWLYQVQGRRVYESAIIQADETGNARLLSEINPGQRNLSRQFTRSVFNELRAGSDVVVTETVDRVEAFTRLSPDGDLYLYAARIYDPQVVARGNAVAADYRALLERSRSLQLRFNALLYLIALAIVGFAVFIALKVADRLVRPVGDLVGAARRVAGGDLTARVERPRSRDEVGTLAAAFNRMTRQLETQTTALVAANDQLDSRRAFTEAVLSGVSAGVVSVDEGGAIRLINRSAAEFLCAPGDDPVGRPLAEIAPELARMIGGVEREAVVQVTSHGEARTLAVKRVRDERGTVLTFDDITQQLLDQRRAAWADVARRIAHEIKNPLTPIQLAAERLQRRYGKEIQSDPSTFARLTETIVRQVGDLRRMVDEFSSFARMPKPVFRLENLIDIARQTLFLHEVAHPAIRFALDAPDPAPTLVCDRRQLAQALTNLVKNAAEAIEARRERDGGGEGAVTMRIVPVDAHRLDLSVEDDGIGLPVERDRLVEPYVTTRARGTGLGLAIVKKIAEEHFGTIGFADRAGGGTVVTMAFDPMQLARLVGSADDGADDEERPHVAMSRVD